MSALFASWYCRECRRFSISVDGGRCPDRECGGVVDHHPLPVISIKQPFAWLTLFGDSDGLKNVESRNWWPNYTGFVWVHASARSYLERDVVQMYPWIDTAYLRSVSDQMPLGAIVGAVHLTDASENSSSRWAVPDSFYWHLEDPQPIVPFSHSGARGFWWLPGDQAGGDQ